ncbi:hypothetical protein A0H81_12521 [Grifola frondosa]|uniref:Uncharacterized protein n=1 Tax=Grifola frondosa TaxID=5627 RepID=A0A1C7LRG8_GRIFR|nr:hypothetical protein A0H81_12521 [Grifola frondosa]
MRTVESLQVELRAATGESAHLASRLAEKEATEDELRSSLARALADASTAVHEITEIKVTVSEQQLSLDQVRSLLQEKEIEATELGDRLVKTEAARNELLSELGEKAGQITTLRENVAAATVHTAQLSSLQGSLFTATDEVGALRTQLDTAETSRVELIARLEEAGAEALSLQDTLQREKERSATLTQDLSLAKTDAQDAEAEIEALLKAKAEDEANISRLKDGFSRLRQVQMECLVEVDHKIAAAHSSPLPNRRRSSVTEASLVPLQVRTWRRQSLGKHMK